MATLVQIAEVGAIGAGVYFAYKLIVKPAIAIQNTVLDLPGNAIEAAKKTWEDANEITNGFADTIGNVVCETTVLKFWSPLDVCKPKPTATVVPRKITSSAQLLAPDFTVVTEQEATRPFKYTKAECAKFVECDEWR